jgi:hypothetical protein
LFHEKLPQKIEEHCTKPYSVQERENDDGGGGRGVYIGGVPSEEKTEKHDITNEPEK